MQFLLALLIGVLVGTGLYLMLQRTLLRVVFGLMLFSNAANLIIFAMGRVRRAAPPLIPDGVEAPSADYVIANPLPQALVLTAIVISFGLIAFALVLLYRNYMATRSVRTDFVPSEPASKP